jgi:5-methylthioadenosine/S-adenosylhomocysteine deaminase
MSQSILIKHGHVLPGDGAPERPRADVLIKDGAIAAIGESLSGEGAEVIEADGMVVMPGFVDSHRHLWQAPLRGVGADMTLVDYFRVVQGQALPAFLAEDTHLATLLGAVEAIDAGITTIFDFSNVSRSPDHTDAAVDALTAAGIRAVLGHTNPDDEAEVQRLAQLTGRVTGGLAIVGPEYGPWDDGVRQIRLGRRLGMAVSMHASGGGPDLAIPRMYEAGLLGPDLNLVHLNNVTADEVKMLVDSDVGVTVTPTVEALMSHGSSSYGRFLDGGGHVALGVDVVINALPDLFEPMRDTLRSERLRTRTMPPAASVLPAATIDGARALGMADRVGSIAVGKRADVILLDGLTHLTHADSIAGAVVCCLGSADVRTVLIDGRIVKRDGHLVGHDLRVLRTAAGELARRVLGAPDVS